MDSPHSQVSDFLSWKPDDGGGVDVIEERLKCSHDLEEYRINTTTVRYLCSQI